MQIPCPKCVAGRLTIHEEPFFMGTLWMHWKNVYTCDRCKEEFV